jgi:hypothetical protein
MPDSTTGRLEGAVARQLQRLVGRQPRRGTASVDVTLLEKEVAVLRGTTGVWTPNGQAKSDQAGRNERNDEPRRDAASRALGAPNRKVGEGEDGEP